MSLSDIDHFYGNDVSSSLTGDLNTVSAIARSNQRIIRRLLTNPGDDLFNLSYGAGLGQQVGNALIDVNEITALIVSQMYLEESVQQNPVPTVTLTVIPNGFTVSIIYVEASTGQSAPLTFDVTP